MSVCVHKHTCVCMSGGCGCGCVLLSANAVQALVVGP